METAVLAGVAVADSRLAWPDSLMGCMKRALSCAGRQACL